MEAILPIVGLIIFWSVISFLLRGAGNVVSGRPFQGLDKLEARIVDATIPAKGDLPAIPLKAIELRGPFPVAFTTEVLASISIRDKRGEGAAKPVFSLWPQTKERTTDCFLVETNLGRIGPGQGFNKWTRLAAFPPIALQPPSGGNQTLHASIWLMDLNSAPEMIGGQPAFPPGESAGNINRTLIWSRDVGFEYSHTGKGYLELVADGDESRRLALGLAVAVATADGEYDPSEAAAINSWVDRYLSGISGPDHQRLRKSFGETIDVFVSSASTDGVSLSSLTQKINELGDNAAKYWAIELCYSVMAADGKIDPEELKTINSISDALGLDPVEVQRIHDGTITLSEQNLSVDASGEELLGIDPTWSNDRKRRHLTQEFQKWNNRLNALPAGVERDNAQAMLEQIGELREQLKR